MGSFLFLKEEELKERRCTKGVKSEIGTKSRCKESWKRSQSMTSPPDLCVHACCEKTQKVHFSGIGGGGVSLHLPSKNSEFFFCLVSGSNIQK